jgi:eukaryotic-like serine/threonine-protein kinase
MRQFFRVLLLALVMLLVALVSALTAMRLAIHGREVAIPKLVGMTLSEAERAVNAAGMQITIERQFYSPDIPEGRIMTQMPPAGTKVRRGWMVRVAQSLGPQRVAIPDVTGQSARVAEMSIRRRSLDLASIAQVNLPDTTADQVVSQNPPGNASGVAAPKINLLVSNGPDAPAFVMPDLTGQPLGSATLALQDAGLRLGRVSMVAAPAPAEGQAAPAAPSPAAQPNSASMIITQNPAAGQKIVTGSAVNFEVR